MIEQKPEEWQRYILHTGLPGEMRKMETKLLVESNAKKNMMSFNRNNADGVPSGGRRKGGINKGRISNSKFRTALEKTIEKTFEQALCEHYIRALAEKDKASIIYYERMFNHKQLLIKVNGKVLYDGRK